MPGFDVHDPQLQMLTDHFIEASAGTGKTYTIEQLVRRLIQEQGLKLEEILIVTFTRAATFELKQRIRSQLQKEGIFHQSEESIFTIHGFCAYSLKDYAFETKFPLETLETSTSIRCVQQIVKDVLKGGLTFLHPKQVERLFILHRQDSDALVKHLSHLVARRIPIEKGPDFFQIDQSIQTALASSSRELLFEDLLSLTSVYGQMRDRKKQIKDSIREDFQQIIEGNWLQPSLLLCTPDNRLKRAEDPLLHHPKLIAQLIAAVEQALDPWPILASVAACVQQRTEQLIAEKEWVFFEDLISLMHQAVQDPSYAQAISQRYRVVLIDEFQDTDPRQWEIFSTLFLHRCPMYLIGDPKQAIYRFRQADIYTYLEAKKQINCCDSLMTNFRSTEPLTRALNELFSHLIFPLPRTQQQLFYQPVLCGKKDEPALLPPVVLLYAPDEEALFCQVTQAIQAHPQLSVAVLVKDRYQAQRFAKACPLPLCLRRSRSILDSSTLTCMEQLLMAVLYPHDHHVLQLLIQGRFQNCRAEDFWSWHTLLKQKGILSCFYQMMRTIGPSLIEQKGGEQLMHDLMHLAEILETRDHDDLLETLDALSQEDPESDEFKGRQISEDQRIQVMTTHVSKGLEFDLVFPIGLALPATDKRDLVYCPTSKMLTYQEQVWHEHQEELKAELIRQVYVACTRAKKRLYIPVLGEESSPMATLAAQASLPQLEEKAVELCPEKASKIKPPRQYTWQAKSYPIVSFTSLVQSEGNVVEDLSRVHGEDCQDWNFPAGPEIGVILHAILEKISFQRPLTANELHAYVKGTKLEAYVEQIHLMLEHIRNMPFPVDKPFTLANVDPCYMQREMPFLYPYEEGYCKGVLDLVFKHQGHYYLIDWKSNLVEGSLEQECARHNYFLQARLYHEALRKVTSALGESAQIHTFFFFLRRRQNAIFRYVPENKHVK